MLDALGSVLREETPGSTSLFDAADRRAIQNTSMRLAPVRSDAGPVTQERRGAPSSHQDNGIDHLLTAPHSPTTTGKVERFHRTLRREFFSKNDYCFETLEEAQAALDDWVVTYNTLRPHQSIGQRPPAERFALRSEPELDIVESEPVEVDPTDLHPARITRRVGADGKIHLQGFAYPTGRWLAGEVVEILFNKGLLEIVYEGEIVATHARRHQQGKEPRTLNEPRHRNARRPTTGPSVTRVVDASGSVSFAGWPYRVGNPYKRLAVEVAVVNRSVQISYEGVTLKTHPIRHDRSREFGAFSRPKGRPGQRNRTAG